MADIRIERKTPNVWAWLLPLLLLLAATWWFFGRGPGDRDRTTAQNDVAPDSAAAYSSSTATRDDSAGGNVADFTAFVSANGASRGENEQHAFTAEGIRRLSKVLDGVMPGTTTTTSTAEMRAQANALENSAAESTRHANMARTAFLAAGQAFGSLPDGRLSRDAVNRVRDAANGVDAEQSLLSQKDRIDAFFAAASRALQELR